MDEATDPPDRSRGVLIAAVIFLLGLLSGAAGFYLGQRSFFAQRGWGGPGGPHPGGGLERLTRELKLDADQRRKIEAILEGRRGRMQQFLEEGRAEIRAVLTPEQQAVFDKMPHDHGGRHGWRSDLPPAPPPPGGPPPEQPPGGAPPPAGGTPPGSPNGAPPSGHP
jgi:Spy/CpxP family protein refolding chaperone